MVPVLFLVAKYSAVLSKTMMEAVNTAEQQQSSPNSNFLRKKGWKFPKKEISRDATTTSNNCGITQLSTYLECETAEKIIVFDLHGQAWSFRGRTLYHTCHKASFITQLVRKSAFFSTRTRIETTID